MDGGLEADSGSDNDAVGVLAEGCPVPGQATAREISVDAHLSGPDAVGGEGDLLLMNEHVAVIVSAPDSELTYYHYGGIVVDAVTLDGCEQASEDQLEEAGIVLGAIDLGDPTASTIRAFRGESAEVIADGSDGGAAVVRVSGVDDRYWLVEFTLINAAIGSGGKALTQPLGAAFEVDYILDPGASVVRIVVRSRNLLDVSNQIIGASLMTFGDALDVHRFANDNLSLGPLNMDLGIPWVVGSNGHGAYAFAIEGGSLGHTNIGGIDLLVDAQQQALLSPNLGPAGVATDSDEMTWFLAIGGTDGSSATRHLESFNPAPADLTYTNVEVTGVVSDGDAGVADATLHIEIEAAGGGWQVIDTMVTDGEGRFAGFAPVFDPPEPLRLRAYAEGRTPGEALPLDPAGSVDLEVLMEVAGTLTYDIVDGGGAPSPARLDLTRDDGWKTTLFVYGEDSAAVPVGHYVFQATRGYEFEPVAGDIVVLAESGSPLTATLNRVVDTSGYLSIDTHVHSAPSPDSRIDQALRIRNAAAHGLEVVVATEHEIIASLQPAVDASGLDHLIATITGQEVTATSPEHMTMVGVEPDGTPRGGFVRWYGLSFPQLIDAMKDRGAGFVIFNHPGYLGRIGWDRIAGAPTVSDATLFGLDIGTQLWGWGFQGVEVQNGHGSPFSQSGNGRFDDWMSFLNHGHHTTAVGCSDTHGLDDTGFPRTYYASPTDDPSALESPDATDALVQGRAVVSSGAFLRVTANDAGAPGDIVAAGDGHVNLHVRVEALSAIDVTHVKVLANCDEVANVVATDPGGVVKLDTTFALELEADAHLVVLAFGAGPMPEGLENYNAATTPRAFTNPIYVDVDGNGAFDAPGGRACSYGLSAP